jgi:hypothetical protein
MGRFDEKPGYGVFEVAFFIADDRGGLEVGPFGVPGFQSHGDGRTWAPGAHWSHSRAAFQVNFDRGVAVGQISPSCGVKGPPGDCHSALSIDGDTGFLATTAEFLPFVADTNKVSVSQSGSTVRVKLEIKNSDKKTISPRISATLEFTPLTNSDTAQRHRLVNVRGQRDPFPAMEIYRRASDSQTWRTVLQDPSGGQAAFSLLPPAPNHSFEVVSSL